jgi:hypothetical protein
MLFALGYWLLRRLIGLAAGSLGSRHHDIEVLILRHQLAVLRRQVSRPRLRRRDRLLMAALSRLLPRQRWSSFLVRPQTLLRWHREVVRRKWTYRHRSTGGRPPIAQDVGDLIVRMGGENPRWGCMRSRESWPSSESRSLRPRPGRSCAATGSDLLHGGRVRPGVSSPGSRPKGPSPLTSYRGDRMASHLLCALRDRTADAACSPGRSGTGSKRRVGDSAGPQPLLRPSRACVNAFPDP